MKRDLMINQFDVCTIDTNNSDNSELIFKAQQQATWAMTDVKDALYSVGCMLTAEQLSIMERTLQIKKLKNLVYKYNHN